MSDDGAKSRHSWEDSDGGTQVTVLASRPVADMPAVQCEVLGANRQAADLLLRFVRESAAARHDDDRLVSVISDFAFSTFPQATHLAVALCEDASSDLTLLVTRSRLGNEPQVALSRTIVEQVMNKGLSLLFTAGEASLTESRSVILSRMRAAICAPLTGLDRPFGVVQLDVRFPGKGAFTRADVDLLAVFADQVALVLDNQRLHQQQKRAFRSTINALVHSLSLKDPGTAHHSERVQAISLLLGRRLGLAGRELEVLGVAAILHDMGKQGVRDDVLFKPDRLTSPEVEEMAGHAVHTQDILDKIHYPEHLKQVPLIAAWHHEKMNGAGPYGIPSDQLPLTSRIISVADVFDALRSPRAYKTPMSLEETLEVLERGRGVEWDARVLDVLREAVPEILDSVYGIDPAIDLFGRAA